jgi:DNA-binding winged helix-turn-helix (wHTH) protein
LRQLKTQRAFSLRFVNQGSAQRDHKAISHDQRAIDRGIPNHQIAPHHDCDPRFTERNRSMSQALKLTLIAGTEAPGSKDRKVRPFVGSRTPSERLQFADAPVLEQFYFDSGFGVRGRVQSPDTDPLKPSKPAGARTSEVSFGPFRLLPAQRLLLEGDKPVPLGSRALELLIVLLERPGELVPKQDLMARVWPNLFVEPANLTVHISALRRALRDGRDGNRFVINIPGRGYCFVAPVTLGRGT